MRLSEHVATCQDVEMKARQHTEWLDLNPANSTIASAGKRCLGKLGSRFFP